MSETDIIKPEWNLNSYKINFLGQKMINSLESFEKHHYAKSFECCASIRRIISNRLTAPETKKCDLYESFIPKQLTKDNNGKIRITMKYRIYLDKYIVYLQVLIKRKGLDLSEKSESSLF